MKMLCESEKKGGRWGKNWTLALGEVKIWQGEKEGGGRGCGISIKSAKTTLANAKPGGLKTSKAKKKYHGKNGGGDESQGLQGK